MKRFFIGFLINSWCGAFVVSIVTGLFFLLMYWWLGVYDELAILLMCIIGLHILALLAVLMAVIVNLARHRLFVGILQITLLVISSAVFVVCLGIENYSLLFSQRYVAEYRNRQHWQRTAETNGIPFAVEFRSRHPAYSWYDSRIVFPSGRRSGVLSGLHYGHTYDVFKLNDVIFCLFTTNSSREREFAYRVNTGAETVELCSGSRWASVPDESMRIVNCDDNTLLVDVRTNRVCIKGTCAVDIRKDEWRYFGRFSALAR